MSKEIKKWIRHYANPVPSKNIVIVRRQVYESNNSKGLFKKNNLIVTTVYTHNIEIPIPFEEVEVEVEHFDNKAFQMDDRFFTTKKTIKRYKQERVNEEIQKALIGYNTTPVDYTTNQK